MSMEFISPRFIETSPSGDDLFQSGAQNKTAASIAEHIRICVSDYRLIGLDGSWGSGKSNVISIIKKQLRDTHHIFIYDAWSHQEDLQRRSFLEGLTDDLQQNHMVDQEEWRGKLKKLLAKKKETIQQTVPKLSYAIIIAFLATILTPITTAISGIIKSDLWKILLACSPILVAFVIWIIACFIDKKYRNFLDLFYLYKEKDLETITNEIITESEPSVLEFRNWMFDLEGSLKKKDLIIVFDNMDRLPSDKVQIIWSSIHTFFSESRTHKRIWVIVPFDRTHIKDAFCSDEEKSDHFINKTFSVIYRVPPAVLTDWWKFFEIKFIEAFGEEERSEFFLVRGIFDRYQTTITPRKVIAFINELVTLKLTWAGEIELRYMALFLANKTAILKDPVSNIIGKDYRARVGELFPNDNQIDDNIAALVYNIPKETATQITLQREIVVAVRDQDFDYLRKLSHHNEFFIILEEVYAKADMDLVTSVHSIGSIAVEEQNGYAKKVLEEIWTKLSIKQINLAIDDLSFVDTQKIILSNCPEHTRNDLIRHFVKQFSISRNFKGSNYYYALNDLDKFIKEKEWEMKLPDLLERIEMLPTDFISYVKEAGLNYNYFKGHCENSVLEEKFIDDLGKDRSEFEILKYLKNDYRFPLLVKKIEVEISGEGLTVTNVSDLLDIYRNLSNDRLLSKRIPDSKVDQLIMEAQENTNEYYELVAMRLSRGNAWAGTSTISATILTNTNPNVVDAIASKIESYSYFSTLLKLAVNWKQPLLSSVVNLLILRPKGASSVNILEVVPLFDQILETTKVTDIELFKRLDAWNNYFKNGLTEQNLKSTVPTLNFYNTALKLQNKTASHLFKIATEFIYNLDESHWSEIFAEEKSYEFILLGFLLKNQILTEIPNKAIKSYKDLLVKISGETEEVWHDNDILNILYASADKRQLKGTIRNIRDSLIQKGNINISLFLLFEECLRVTGSLEERAPDFFRRILAPIINDEIVLNKIDLNMDYYLTIFSKAGEERLDFAKVIRRAKEEKPDIEILSRISKLLDDILTKNINIYEAKYFTDEHSVDVTEKLKHVVEREGVLHFIIDNGIVDWNDPHPNVQKRLSIKFEFDGKVFNHTYNEGEWLNIP